MRTIVNAVKRENCCARSALAAKKTSKSSSSSSSSSSALKGFGVNVGDDNNACLDRDLENDYPSFSSSALKGNRVNVWDESSAALYADVENDGEGEERNRNRHHRKKKMRNASSVVGEKDDCVAAAERKGIRTAMTIGTTTTMTQIGMNVLLGDDGMDARARSSPRDRRRVLNEERELKIETVDGNTTNEIYGNVSDIDFIRVAMNNPEVTAIVALASVVILPKAIEQIGKKIVLPLALFGVVVGFAMHPESAGAFIASSFGFLVGHPKLVAAFAVALLALRLSPYLIIALLLFVLFNVSNLLPDEMMNPLLPAYVKESVKTVKKDVKIARDALKPLETIATESLSDLENFKREIAIKKEQARNLRIEKENIERELKERPRKEAEAKLLAAKEALEKKK